MKQGLNTIIHRTDRCDLNLFQLGLRKKEYLLNQDMEIPIAFCREESNVSNRKKMFLERRT